MKLVHFADRQLTIAELNTRFPVGTPCIYHSVRGRDGVLEGPGLSTRTRSVFWELGHGRQVSRRLGQELPGRGSSRTRLQPR